jgi:hypothetical protein
LSHLGWLALPAFLILAWFKPRLGDTWFGAIERLGARFAVRKRAVLVAVPVTVIALRLALFPVLPLPTPTCHDEFSYLLAGDTFAHGRLTNPPHPMWLFLDTFHVLQHPTYGSIFPPGQGAALALGEILGHPWIGVLLSMAIMTAALTWMLQGWFPPKWALLGAVLVIFRIVVFSYWMESYWGGAVAAAGGALVLGALPRMFRYYRSRDALLMSIGAFLLANSRPYEGFLFCVPVGIAIMVWLWSSRSPSLKVTGQRVLVPLLCMLALTVVFIGYYNWRVTGNPIVLPHALYDTQYINYRVFIWEKLHPPLHYANRQFELYFNGWLRGPHKWGAKQLFVMFAQFFLGSVLCVPLVVTFPWMVRDRRVRFPLIQLVFSILGSLLVAVIFMPHHQAPLTATVFLLLVQAIRHLRRWQVKGRPVGMFLTRLVVILVLARIAFYIARPPSLVEAVGPERAKLVKQLDALPNRQLVIVRYSPDHFPFVEWVYNAADVDHAKVVWAREIPGVDMNPLFEYFRGRTILLLEPDRQPVQLRPYSSAAAAEAPKPSP